MNNNLTPKIYVACLAAYNSGFLHGNWIDATQDAQTIYDEISTILAKSPCPNAEEWAIHDFEDFGSVHIGESESINFIVEIAAFITEHGELGAELMNYYHDIDTARDALEDCYQGEFDSELSFAQGLFDECYADSIPESISSYIDYDSFARDLFLDGYISFEVNHKVHVFSMH